MSGRVRTRLALVMVDFGLRTSVVRTAGRRRKLTEESYRKIAVAHPELGGFLSEGPVDCRAMIYGVRRSCRKVTVSGGDCAPPG
jgi:hypothetical protein